MSRIFFKFYNAIDGFQMRPSQTLELCHDSIPKPSQTALLPFNASAMVAAAQTRRIEIQKIRKFRVACKVPGHIISPSIIYNVLKFVKKADA